MIYNFRISASAPHHVSTESYVSFVQLTLIPSVNTFQFGHTVDVANKMEEEGRPEMVRGNCLENTAIALFWVHGAIIVFTNKG